MFWELYGHPDTDPASDRILTNAFAAVIEGWAFLTVFPEISVSLRHSGEKTPFLTSIAS